MSNVPFLIGKNLTLTVLSEDDVLQSNWASWFNDEETTFHMQQHYFPNTQAMQMEFLKTLEKNTSKIQLGILPGGERKIAGVISLGPVDWINRNADISMIIGEGKYRTLVYAQEALKLVIEHAFYTLNLHKVYVGYTESLQAWGLFMQRRFGFKDEGHRKEHAYKHGVYKDIFLLGLLRKDYQKP